MAGMTVREARDHLQKILGEIEDFSTKLQGEDRYSTVTNLGPSQPVPPPIPFASCRAMTPDRVTVADYTQGFSLLKSTVEALVDSLGATDDRLFGIEKTALK
jgi:hypothetical protein